MRSAQILLLTLAAFGASAGNLCPPQKLQAARYSRGESLSFRLDALGADVGTFEVSVEQAPEAERPKAALLLKSRARTSAFVSSAVKSYEAYATALLGPDFSPLRYREDLDEGSEHRSQEVAFPPQNGKLQVQATKNGQPDPALLDATDSVREMISALYVIHAQPLQKGQPVCLEVYAGRRVWRVQGLVAGRERIETPLGSYATARIDATAVRADDPSVKRAAHFWITDDERRVPLAAIGEVRGKTIRAQLVAASALPRPAKRVTRPEHSGAAIGR